MRRAPRRLRAGSVFSTSLLVAASLLGVACDGGGGGGKGQAASSTSATAAPPTSAGPPAGPTFPLTGLPAAAPSSTPALIVKIDNAMRARPQAGINDADVVVEEGVEGGVTRFATIFQSRPPSDATPVGPVRSARSTDLIFARQLSRPLFAYSGANAVFAGLVSRAPLVDVGVGRFPTAYHREPGRPAPYNLFSDTKALFGSGPPGLGAPPALFAFRAPGEAPPAEGSEAAPKVQALWKLNITTTVVYAWDPATRAFPRTTDGAAHLDAAGKQVAPDNVVFQLCGYRDTGLVDRSGAAVPEAQLVGEGDAWALTAGRLVKGHWSRPSEDAVTTYTLPSGQPIRLTPGRTWLELVPLGNLKSLG